MVEDETNVWLTWGSFWSGIEMRRVDSSTGKLSDRDTTLYALSSRPREQPINGSVEAPFITRHGDYCGAGKVLARDPSGSGLAWP